MQKGALDKAIEKMKAGKPIDCNFWTENYETPLIAAVMNNDANMITFLIENGAMTDYRNGEKDGCKTPLHVAAIHNKQLAVKVKINLFVSYKFVV